jgi:hypothetical protein
MGKAPYLGERKRALFERSGRLFNGYQGLWNGMERARSRWGGKTGESCIMYPIRYRLSSAEFREVQSVFFFERA